MDGLLEAERVLRDADEAVCQAGKDKRRLQIRVDSLKKALAIVTQAEGLSTGTNIRRA